MIVDDLVVSKSSLDERLLSSIITLVADDDDAATLVSGIETLTETSINFKLKIAVGETISFTKLLDSDSLISSAVEDSFWLKDCKFNEYCFKKI